MLAQPEHKLLLLLPNLQLPLLPNPPFLSRPLPFRLRGLILQHLLLRSMGPRTSSLLCLVQLRLRMWKCLQHLLLCRQLQHYLQHPTRQQRLRRPQPKADSLSQSRTLTGMTSITCFYKAPTNPLTSLPKPSIVKGRVQRDSNAVSNPSTPSREPPQGPNNRANDPPTEPRRPTPSAPRLDLAKLNGMDAAKGQPVTAQPSARSSRPPTPTGPRKHNTLDSPRLGRASMPGPTEPSSTSTAQELRKFSAEKAAEKSAAAAAAVVASSDRTPSRRSSVDGRRSVSPRPSRRNASADSRASERTRDKTRDRDRERHDDRDRDRERDKDRDKDRDKRNRSGKGRSDRDKEKDREHRKRSGDGSRGRGHEEEDESGSKRHKTSTDEVRLQNILV